MRLALDTLPALIEQIPDLAIERVRANGRKHVQHRQRGLGRIISETYHLTNPHARERLAQSFSRDYLTETLRADAKTYHKHLWPFFRFPEGNREYNRDQRVTKPYRLHASVEAGYAKAIGPAACFPVVNAETGDLVRVAELPACGLPVDLSLPFHVPAVLPLSVAAIDRVSARVAAWRDRCGPHFPLNPEKPSGTTLEEALRLLALCRQWVESLGGLPNFYATQSHGRLGPVGLHVIQLPSMLRQLLLAETGWVDYDLRACHWTVFLALTQGLGAETPTVADYVARRGEWHQHWKTLTRHDDPSSFKAVASSWLTGGTLSSARQTQSTQLLGREAMERLGRDPDTQQLYDEVREGMLVILKAHSMAETTCVNAVGAAVPRSGPDRAKLGQLYSHLLTGYEQWAIRECCAKVPELHAIIYDGFIAAPTDVEPLEAHLASRSAEVLGVCIPFRLKEEPFSTPVQEPEADPWDF